MRTTLKPTPGRKLPQNLMKKLVSLEFPVSGFPCEPASASKMQFSGRLKAFLVTLYSMGLSAGFEVLLL